LTAKYSYNWAKGVVNNLRQSYPRATEIVVQTTGFSLEKVERIVAENRSDAWYRWKLLVHLADRLLRGGMDPATIVLNVKAMQARKANRQVSASTAVTASLTSRPEGKRLIEQSKRRVPTEVTEEGTQLLFDFGG